MFPLRFTKYFAKFELAYNKMNCKWHLTLHRECSQFVLQTLKAVNKKHARQKAITYTRLIKSDLVKPRSRNLWKGWKDQLGPFSTSCCVGDSLWITTSQDQQTSLSIFFATSFGTIGFTKKYSRLGYFHHETLICYAGISWKCLGLLLLFANVLNGSVMVKFLWFTRSLFWLNKNYSCHCSAIWFSDYWVTGLNLDKTEKFSRKSELEVTHLRSVHTCRLLARLTARFFGLCCDLWGCSHFKKTGWTHFSARLFESYNGH